MLRDHPHLIGEQSKRNLKRAEVQEDNQESDVIEAGERVVASRSGAPQGQTLQRCLAL